MKLSNKEIKMYKEGLKNFLVHGTECELQSGWPCATCTVNFLDQLGIKEDGDHNENIDRVNEVWRAILQVREAK